MVSSNEADFDLRETPPLPRNILQDLGLSQGYTGQRMSPRILPCSKGYRSWLLVSTSLKVSASHLTYLADMRDSAKSGLGHCDNRHLNYLVESIAVNVGGSCRNVKASSPPMPGESVGGVIVLGAQESCVQGEGRQGVNTFLVESRSKSDEFQTFREYLKALKSNGNDESESNFGQEMLTPGEPSAGKLARWVRRGECGNVH